MSWFRLDDHFHSHPKVKAAGNATAGLWVRCGTWSSSYETDGVIPFDIVRSMGTKAEIGRAVDTRLWVVTDDGMLIPDYLDFNPSRADMEQRRKRDAERKRRGRSATGQDPRNGQFTSLADPDPYT